MKKVKAVKSKPAKVAPVKKPKKASAEKKKEPKALKEKRVTKAPKESKKESKKSAKEVVEFNNSSPEDKQQIIESFAQGKGDTGSPEVQVALLSFKIGRLTGHLEENKKDNHSRRGLLKVIAKRRRILNYLQDLDKDRYKGLIERLGLKK